jgi:transposase
MRGLAAPQSVSKPERKKNKNDTMIARRGMGMEYISGEDREQIIMLPERIDEYVDGNNAVRVIDAYINSLNLGELGFARPEPNGTGRPAYDPKDLLKLYVYGYMNRIRSSRRLETESKRNVELIWLMRKLAPDFKTIARFRHDNTDALKNAFRDFVRLCVRLGLYGKELVAIDGSKFKAVNSKDRNFTKDKLKDRIKRLDEKIAEYLAELEESDRQEDSAVGEKPAEEIARIVRELSKRKERYETYEKELEETGQTQKSLTDKDSRLMPANGKMDVCYNVQTAVDAGNKLIAAFEVTNNANDANQITPMVSRVREALGAEVMTVVADAGYDSAQDISTAMAGGIEVHVAGTDYDVCVPAPEGEQTEIHSHKGGRCVYNAERNIALCPMGNVLYPRHYKTAKGLGVFYNRAVCKRCECKCSRETRGFRFQVPMAEGKFSKEYDDTGLTVRQVRVKGKKEITAQRKSIAEHPFGTIKRSMDAGYCLTKGIGNVSGEFALVFLAYNLKRVINILGGQGMIEKIGCYA